MRVVNVDAEQVTIQLSRLELEHALTALDECKHEVHEVLPAHQVGSYWSLASDIDAAWKQMDQLDQGPIPDEAAG